MLVSVNAAESPGVALADCARTRYSAESAADGFALMVTHPESTAAASVV